MDLIRVQKGLSLATNLLLASVLSTACSNGGGSNSSTELSKPTIQPEPGKTEVLVYETRPDTGPSRLYKVNRTGETTLLSGAAGDMPVDGFSVSPDGEQLAYRYTADTGQPTLAVVDLASGDAAPPRLAGAGETIFQQWLPNSRGLLYRVYNAEFSSVSLFLATMGVADDMPLMSTGSATRVVMDVSVSADSNHAAILTQDRDADFLVPLSSRLYLLDLVAMDEPLLIESTTGDANTFELDWSPEGDTLLYAQWRYIGPTAPGISVSQPAGPLVLLGPDRVSRPLADYPNFYIFPWIDENHFVVSRRDGFDLWDTEGALLAAPDRTGYWQVESSPDKRWIAWLAPEAGAVAVHLLNVETGEARSVGPASATEYPPGDRFVNLSTLHWSPDGSWLAWSRELDKLEGVPAELYAYRMSTGETRLLSTRLSNLAGGFSSPWLPQGQRLGYFEHTANGVDLSITDLEADRSDVVGSSAVPSDCGASPGAVWGPSNEVLWYRCGEGLDLFQLATNGAVTQKRLLDGKVDTLNLSANRQFALVELPVAEDSASELPPNRMMYDFLEDRLVELPGTEGNYPLFEFLQ